MSDNGGGYDIVMPFVVCATNGGPFDDTAYVCGWEMGSIDARLAAAKAADAMILGVMIHAENLPQMELLAMKHGVLIDAVEIPEEAPEWRAVRLAWF